jgi:hypothetical protein
MMNDGKSTVPLGVRVLRELADVIKQEASRRDTSISRLIRTTLRKEFAQPKESGS